MQCPGRLRSAIACSSAVMGRAIPSATDREPTKSARRECPVAICAHEPSAVSATIELSVAIAERVMTCPRGVLPSRA